MRIAGSDNDARLLRMAGARGLVKISAAADRRHDGDSLRLCWDSVTWPSCSGRSDSEDPRISSPSLGAWLQRAQRSSSTGEVAMSESMTGLGAASNWPSVVAQRVVDAQRFVLSRRPFMYCESCRGDQQGCGLMRSIPPPSSGVLPSPYLADLREVPPWSERRPRLRDGSGLGLGRGDDYGCGDEAVEDVDQLT